MPKASEIKKNQPVEYNGRVYFVKDIANRSHQAGKNVYRAGRTGAGTYFQR